MKIYLIAIGKTDDEFIIEGIEKYRRRIVKYHPFEIISLPDIKKSKKLAITEQKKQEGELLLKELVKYDNVILLDEKGKSYSSVDFSQLIEKQMVSGIKSLAFVIGGPYGFSNDIYQKFKQKISLSKMTISHQLVRLFFVEQLYRVNTIIKGEPYHHQ